MSLEPCFLNAVVDNIFHDFLLASCVSSSTGVLWLVPQSLHSVLPVSLGLSLLLQEHKSYWIRTHSNDILIWSYLQRPFFQVRSQLLEVRNSTYLFERYNSTYNKEILPQRNMVRIYSRLFRNCASKERMDWYT